jgi:hypothetical protein
MPARLFAHLAALLLVLPALAAMPAAPANGPRVPPSVAQLPADAVRINYCDVDFFFSGGWWYRLYNKRYEPVSPSVGIEIDKLPAEASTVTANGSTYRLLNGVYYQRDGKRYSVVEAPRAKPFGPDDPASHPEAPLYITPRNGQSRDRQAQDHTACDAWAVRINGYDPQRPNRKLSADEQQRKRGEHRRSVMACMDGRGYSAM